SAIATPPMIRAPTSQRFDRPRAHHAHRPHAGMYAATTWSPSSSSDRPGLTGTPADRSRGPHGTSSPPPGGAHVRGGAGHAVVSPDRAGSGRGAHRGPCRRRRHTAVPWTGSQTVPAWPHPVAPVHATGPSFSPGGHTDRARRSNRARATSTGSAPAPDASPAVPATNRSAPPSAPTRHQPLGARIDGRAANPTTSGRSPWAGGPAWRPIAQPTPSRRRPTTRRTTGTLVVASGPISDPDWKRRAVARLLDAVPGRVRPVGRLEKPLPRLRWGRNVGTDAHPTPGPPRDDRRRPARPPTRPAGGGLPRGRAHRSGPSRRDGGRRGRLPQRVEHHVQHRDRPRLVQRGVAVAALGRLHAGRAAGAALAVGDRGAGGGEPPTEDRVTALGEARAARVAVVHEHGRP